MKRRKKSKPFDIKELRQQLGLTQAEFAERLGVNQATISRWETCWEKGLPISRMARMYLERLQQEA
jgi:DNA-binding transcriptional regulator YiaG